MSLYNFAKSELERIEKDEDGMQDHMNYQILKLVEEFASQGHSGFSAGYAIATLNRLLSYKPLTPLTGEDDEWNEVGYNGESKQQNNRCGHIFRYNNDNSTAYNGEGKIFSDNGGESWYTSNASHVPIKFPYYVPNEPEKVLIGSDGIERPYK